MAVSGHHSSTIQGFLVPAGYEQVTSLGTAVGLASIPDGAKIALIQAESQSVRWRDDGTVPTAAIGMVIIANDTLLYSGVLSAIKFIQTAVSAKLNVTYYK